MPHILLGTFLTKMLMEKQISLFKDLFPQTVVLSGLNVILMITGIGSLGNNGTII